jgi:hypothetical protein
MHPDNSIELAFKCANMMLEKKYISYVFFAADNERLRTMAEQYISDQKALVQISSKLQFSARDGGHDGDNTDIRTRDGMHAAVLEWYLMGEADYCITTSPHSTFSKTAIVRGKCKVMSYHAGEDCDPLSQSSDKYDKPLEDKESLLWVGDMFGKATVKIPESSTSQVWDSIWKYRASSLDYCGSGNPSEDVNLIEEFWIDSSKLGHKYLNEDGN